MKKSASELRSQHGPTIGNALNVLNKLIENGMEYPDAEFRVIKGANLSDSQTRALRTAYDGQV